MKIDTRFFSDTVNTIISNGRDKHPLTINGKLDFNYPIDSQIYYIKGGVELDKDEQDYCCLPIVDADNNLIGIGIDVIYEYEDQLWRAPAAQYNLSRKQKENYKSAIESIKDSWKRFSGSKFSD